MDGVAPDPAAFHAMPPEAPLAMPVQSLRTKPGRHAGPSSSPPHMALRRLLVVGGAVALTAVAAREMVLVLGVNGLTPLAMLILVLFVVLFAWIALALVSAVCGFVSMLRGTGRRLDQPGEPPIPQGRTALLMPAYNEQPARIMAALQVIHAELDRLGGAAHFDLFILSDTTRPAAWIAEEAAFLSLRAAIGAQVFYRHRPINTDRKAGNIADWTTRWGGAYPQFMILDADSVMTGECILRLVAAMERTPDAGLIQTLPVITGAQTLFARMQQFAGRVYGPMIAHGIAWWHGAEGNYWGHNAMIRTRAFAEAAGLPHLRGRKPFGGHVLSHDFVEAALLRRAGWAVHMMPALPGSYEEGPPSLSDVGVRDRRWCQGNLQHIAVLPARGLHWISRLHLMMGIGSYVTAPLWLLFLVTGILLSLQARFVLPDYFPRRPLVVPALAGGGPGAVDVGVRRHHGRAAGTQAAGDPLPCCSDTAERRACGGGGGLVASLLLETVLAGLVAPVAMLTQSAAVVSILAGRDGGWAPQRRDDGVIPLRDTVRQYWPHTAIGALLGLASWAVSLPLLLWMTPVVAGLVLAIPLAAWTARRSAGRAMRRAGLLRTPEETRPPAVLVELAQAQPAYLQPEMEPVRRLLSDPGLLNAHRAMLPPPRRPGDSWDGNLLLGRAKLAEAADLDAALPSLTRAELAAVLNDAACLDRMQHLAASASG